jgi:hypothetical protein
MVEDDLKLLYLVYSHFRIELSHFSLHIDCIDDWSIKTQVTIRRDLTFVQGISSCLGCVVTSFVFLYRLYQRLVHQNPQVTQRYYPPRSDFFSRNASDH